MIKNGLLACSSWKEFAEPIDPQTQTGRTEMARQVVVGVDAEGRSTVISDNIIEAKSSLQVGGKYVTAWRGTGPWTLPSRGAPLLQVFGRLSDQGAVHPLPS